MARKRVLSLLLAAALMAGASVAVAQASTHGRSHRHHRHHRGSRTATPIKHLVVIFQENVSFDHYFGTYPHAANTDGQRFHASRHTPTVNGLSGALLTQNPNAANPQRLDSSPTGLPGSAGGQLTCDQDHNYTDEQTAFDSFKMDKFVESVGADGGSTTPFGTPCDPKTVMDYYDGNTVTGLWNYAQHFAMSDNEYGTTFGPSTPGAIDLASGDTGGVDMTHTANTPTSGKPNADLTPDGKGGFSLTNDAQPYWDDCSTRDAVGFSGKNIGDLLNAKRLSWGWFEGGERPSTSYADALTAVHASGQPTSTFIPNQFTTYFTNPATRPANSANQALCSSVHPVGAALGGTGQWGYKDDYIPHHEPFDYYASTANPHHLTIPTDSSGNDTRAGLRRIGTDTQTYVGGVPQFDTPNHQYDTSDFDQLVAAIRKGQLPPSALPAVSFLKAPGYQDGHAGYSDPKDEQQFIASEINALERTPDWSDTAVVVLYDDSDGWYDHANSGVTNPSLSPADNLTNTNTSGSVSGQCGPNPQTSPPLAGEQGRCGFGPRQPLLLISPFAKQNYVDHHLSDTASVINLVEYNWRLPTIAGSADHVLAGRDASKRIPFDLAGLFQFRGKDRADQLFLNPKTGEPTGRSRRHAKHKHGHGGGHSHPNSHQ